MAESISKDRLQQEFDQYVIIDVREPDELENGSIDDKNINCDTFFNNMSDEK